MTKPSRGAAGDASKFGQLIGQAFDAEVYRFIEQHLREKYPDYVLLKPSAHYKATRLEMLGGTLRQMDNIITPAHSQEPVALVEAKWLKDARHHNDKGAWILQLREVRKRYPTIRGVVANLAGYWTDSIGVMFQQEGQIRMVLVATDEEVYQTLQPHLDAYCQRHQLPSLRLEAAQVRKRLPRPRELVDFLVDLAQSGTLAQVAQTWFHFPRRQSAEGDFLTGGSLVKQALDAILQPLPDAPTITRFEIALHVSTGNLIYREFVDLEEAIQFLQLYHRNPEAILRIITPRDRHDLR